MSSVHGAPSEHSVYVLYDLRDAYDEAVRSIRQWGREHTGIHAMSPHHVLLEFRPGGGSPRPNAPTESEAA